MSAAPPPPDDDQRVAALHRYGILDQPPSPDLEALVGLASHIAGTEIAVLNLIDRDRQWQAAAHGMEAGEVARDESMCAHTVSIGRQVHVEDARDDPRFVDNPFVTGEIADVRLYAGTPLVDPDGFCLGTLCVVDSAAGHLDAGQLAALGVLADQAVRLFDLHHRSVQLTDALTELDHAAAHDPLTGLPNRRRFTDELAGRLAEEGAAGPDMLVLFLDLDGFKAVNDGHGHAAGDEVLRAVAERLRAVLRPDDLVARLGGDEFAILCHSCDEASVGPLVERLRGTVAEPVVLADGVEVAVGLSVGTAAWVEGADLDALLARADEQMYDDKRSRRAAR